MKKKETYLFTKTDYTQPLIDSKPVKKTGIRRQVLMISIICTFISSLGLSSYFIFIPRNKRYVLQQYEYSSVKIGDLESILELSGVVFIREKELVRAPVAGLVENVFIIEGEIIGKNQLCMKLISEDIEFEIDSLKTQHERLTFEYDRNSEIYKLESAISDQQVDLLNKNFENKKGLYEIEKKLNDKNLSSSVNLIEAEYKMKDANFRLSNKRADIEAAFIKYTYAQLIKKNDQSQIDEQLRKLKERANKSSIYNRVAGNVVSINFNINDFVYKNDILFTVHNKNSAVIMVEVPESKIDLILLGGSAQIVVGGKKYPGTVNRIGNEAKIKQTSYESVIEVEITLESWKKQLMSGISAEAEIFIGINKGVLYLPRSQYIISGNQQTVYVIRGNKAFKTRVEYGPIDGSKVIIENGLEMGDQVITSGYSEYLDFDDIDLNLKGGRKI